MNKNSNTYIIVYSTIMVVIVAVLLSVASLSLQDRQTANELNEKKNNILTSLGLDAATVDFDNTISVFQIDNAGEATPIEATEAFKLIKTNRDLRDQIAEGNYILFQATDGRVVVPVVGKGLWDDIWGYVALESDLNTIAGIVLAHKGETPGLGAEIASAKHQAQYPGRKIFQEGEFVSVKLVKGGAKDADYEVDAITGGTKTSDGVTAMLYDCLKNYVPYFQKATTVTENAEEAAPEAPEAEEEQQTENNQ